MADINVGNNANLLKGAIDSHDTTYNSDNRVDNSITNNSTVTNTTLNNNIFQAQKTLAQQRQENVQIFTDEVIRFCSSPEMTSANGMLNADAFHQLNMLKLRLMRSQQEADSIIAQVQQSFALTRQYKQNEAYALQQEQKAKTMASMAPPMPSMPSMPSPPPMPKFDAQNVQLNQMQGFNPLQAAKNLGIGMMPTMGAMPQIPGFQQVPQMSSAPTMSTRNPALKAEPEELVIPENPPSTQLEERFPQYGIIFTDSVALAEKYCCQPQDVFDIINEFAQTASEADMHWYFLDAGNYRNTLNVDYWGDYNDLLAGFIHDNGFQVGVCTPVFIIGGTDVIPVPDLENPQYGGTIPTDMAYCFSTTFFSDLWDGDHTIEEDYVRNTVSRLPLEVGKMRSSLQDDLQSYFNLCSIFTDGIDIPGVVMASNVDWSENSVTMSQHLPLIHQRIDNESEIYKGMYMCPKLVTDGFNTEENVDLKVLNDYKAAIDKAGMLVFNLHGSDSKGNSGFYCNGDGGYPESFNIELMRQSNARVFNTVACFGARYDGYERDDSMLLSALLGGGKLLYAGSSVSVPMISDDEQIYPAGVTQYPGSGSEKFMPLYCYYQFCALPAGQAMMRAKLDYFNTFRHIERDDFSLSTVMMFGLYGNPMLHVKVRQDVIDEALRYEVLPQLPETKASHVPIRMKRTKCIIDKEQLHSSKSLLDQLRGCVDQNLKVIHGIVQQNLYNQLGLEPRWLDEVDEFELFDELGKLHSGYLYHYDDDNKYGRKSIIEVNKQGEITRKVTFK